MTLTSFTAALNEWGRLKIPFFFLVDFELKKPLAWRLADISPAELLYDVAGFSNASRGAGNGVRRDVNIRARHLMDAARYQEKFDKVFAHLTYGDTFLANLTIETDIELSHDLYTLFFASDARYRLWMNNELLVFSPETFVRIEDGMIRTFPMKGTIDARIPNARDIILADKKELAEHTTIVDLLRNDLSQIATEVTVRRFRYIDYLKTSDKSLLQVSSEISGRLPPDFSGRIGELLVRLLPAGSVSGAPKPKTLEVIREAEGTDRGYYTGVMGYYDGRRLDSGVMIRYIEKRGSGYVYRSGGGITTQSTAAAEFQEAIDKVYVPVH